MLDIKQSNEYSTRHMKSIRIRSPSGLVFSYECAVGVVDPFLELFREFDDFLG
jgi:hypothetical protein